MAKQRIKETALSLSSTRKNLMDAHFDESSNKLDQYVATCICGKCKHSSTVYSKDFTI